MSLELEIKNKEGKEGRKGRKENKEEKTISSPFLNTIYQTYGIKSDVKEEQEALINFYIKHEYKHCFEVFKKHKNNIMMGNCYWFGRGVEKNDKKAFECYEEARKMGNSQGWIEVGDCYWNGRGVEKNYKKAFECYEEARKMGNSRGWITMGHCYWNGRGVEKNDKKAFEYYEEARKMGNSWGWITMGHCYWFGRGVEKNDKKAFECFEEARKMGDSWGWIKVGNCYWTGRGVEKNDKKAFEYYEEARKMGRDVSKYISRFSKEQLRMIKLEIQVEKQAEQIKDLQLALFYGPNGQGLEDVSKDFKQLQNSLNKSKISV